MIARHEAFLECRPVARPLLGFWVGGYYPAEQFPCGTAGWREGQHLSADDVSFERFAPDYENLFRVHQDADDDFFYVGSPYWGIPWMEAILGCSITVARSNCASERCLESPERGKTASLDLRDNPWFRTLVRFTQDLVAFADNRFPVCAPLLRGPGDCASAMLGGMPFVMGFMDDPVGMQALLRHCSAMRLAVTEALQALIPAWNGTYAAGGFPSKIWCRHRAAYHQDDSAALLNPDLFRRFLLPVQREQCAAAEVNFLHLHSSCVYPVDLLLESRCFDVLEMNIDHPGGGAPSLTELLPVLGRIQEAGCPLLLWGELTPMEWRRLRGELSPAGLSLQPVVGRLSDVPEIRESLM